MRKWLCSIIIGTFTCTPSLFPSENPESLAVALEQAVVLAQSGEYLSAAHAFNNLARKPRPIKDVSAHGDNLREMHAGVAVLGETDGIERLSMKFLGESFCRIRVADKRADGVILWTFIGYRFRDEWFLQASRVNGGDDLMKIMREDLDAADVR